MRVAKSSSSTSSSSLSSSSAAGKNQAAAAAYECRARTTTMTGQQQAVDNPISGQNAANSAQSTTSSGSSSSSSEATSSNWSSQQQSADGEASQQDYMQHMTIILVSLHLTVFVTGLVGNSLVCLSVYRNKSLQTITNYYIVNLAVADFLVILICLPPTVYWDLTLTWNFGLILCKSVLYLQVSISISISISFVALFWPV